MSIVRVSKRERFVVMDKTGIEDARLSFKATGLLAYLLSKPDDWTINYRDLVKVKMDRQHSILAGLRELETHGYLRRERSQTRDGTWTWEQVLYEAPSPCVGNQSTVFDHAWEDHARKTHASTEEGSTEETPPTPPRVGGRKPSLRSKGENPRAVAARRERELIEAEIEDCATCGGHGWTCTRCARRLERAKELAG